MEVIAEVADQPARGTEYCIPHKIVIQDEAAWTKLCVVYDASAKAHPNAVLLNDCLYSGPPLQKNCGLCCQITCTPWCCCGRFEEGIFASEN